MPEPTHAFITSRYCPDCGYELTGLTLAARVTCPECGVISTLAGLLREPPPGPIARTCRALSWCWNGGMRILIPVMLVAGLLGVLIPATGRVTKCGRPWAAELRQIHMGCVIYAADEAGYPAHAAALVSEWLLSPDLLEDDYAQGCFYVGKFDVCHYDDSREATQALTAAIESTDLKAPYYRLGNLWWVRLPAPTNDPSIVAGWQQSQGSRPQSHWVIFDDGHCEVIPPSRWRDIWQGDTRARRKFGLTPVIPPSP